MLEKEGSIKYLFISMGSFLTTSLDFLLGLLLAGNSPKTAFLMEGHSSINMACG